MGCATESQELKELSFGIAFRKIKSQFQKNAKYPIFGPFLPKFGQKWIFYKNWALSLSSIYSHVTSCKISDKTNEPIQRKILY